MDLTLITVDEEDDYLVGALRGRQLEWQSYELNRRNYERVLASPAMKALPEEWPEGLAPYKDITGEALVKAVAEADYVLVTQLQFRDQVRLLLKTTLTEQYKGVCVHAALDEQKPDKARVDAALARILVAEAARKAQR